MNQQLVLSNTLKHHGLTKTVINEVCDVLFDTRASVRSWVKVKRAIAALNGLSVSRGHMITLTKACHTWKDIENEIWLRAKAQDQIMRRRSRNPQTGAVIDIPASKTVIKEVIPASKITKESRWVRRQRRISSVKSTQKITKVMKMVAALPTLTWGGEVNLAKVTKRFTNPGFGTWTVKKRAARTVRNPQTGDTVKIKEVMDMTSINLEVSGTTLPKISSKIRETMAMVKSLTIGVEESKSALVNAKEIAVQEFANAWYDDLGMIKAEKKVVNLRREIRVNTLALTKTRKLLICLRQRKTEVKGLALAFTKARQSWEKAVANLTFAKKVEAKAVAKLQANANRLGRKYNVTFKHSESIDAPARLTGGIAYYRADANVADLLHEIGHILRGSSEVAADAWMNFRAGVSGWTRQGLVVRDLSWKKAEAWYEAHRRNGKYQDAVLASEGHRSLYLVTTDSRQEQVQKRLTFLQRELDFSEDPVVLKAAQSEINMIDAELDMEELDLCSEGHDVIRGGIYRHFKGNEYQVLGFAEGMFGESYVVYMKMYGDYGRWIRPIDMWSDRPEAANGSRRFEYLYKEELNMSAIGIGHHSESEGSITVFEGNGKLLVAPRLQPLTKPSFKSEGHKEDPIPVGNRVNAHRRITMSNFDILWDESFRDLAGINNPWNRVVNAIKSEVPDEEDPDNSEILHEVEEGSEDANEQAIFDAAVREHRGNLTRLNEVLFDEYGVCRDIPRCYPKTRELGAIIGTVRGFKKYIDDDKGRLVVVEYEKEFWLSDLNSFEGGDESVQVKRLNPWQHREAILGAKTNDGRRFYDAVLGFKKHTASELLKVLPWATSKVIQTKLGDSPLGVLWNEKLTGPVFIAMMKIIKESNVSLVREVVDILSIYHVQIKRAWLHRIFSDQEITEIENQGNRVVFDGNKYGYDPDFQERINEMMQNFLEETNSNPLEPWQMLKAIDAEIQFGRCLEVLNSYSRSTQEDYGREFEVWTNVEDDKATYLQRVFVAKAFQLAETAEPTLAKVKVEDAAKFMCQLGLALDPIIDALATDKDAPLGNELAGYLVSALKHGVQSNEKYFRRTLRAVQSFDLPELYNHMKGYRFHKGGLEYVNRAEDGTSLHAKALWDDMYHQMLGSLTTRQLLRWFRARDTMGLYAFVMTDEVLRSIGALALLNDRRWAKYEAALHAVKRTEKQVDLIEDLRNIGVAPQTRCDLFHLFGGEYAVIAENVLIANEKGRSPEPPHGGLTEMSEEEFNALASMASEGHENDIHVFRDVWIVYGSEHIHNRPLRSKGLSKEDIEEIDSPLDTVTPGQQIALVWQKGIVLNPSLELRDYILSEIKRTDEYLCPSETRATVVSAIYSYYIPGLTNGIYTTQNLSSEYIDWLIAEGYNGSNLGCWFNIEKASKIDSPISRRKYLGIAKMLRETFHWATTPLQGEKVLEMSLSFLDDHLVAWQAMQMYSELERIFLAGTLLHAGLPLETLGDISRVEILSIRNLISWGTDGQLPQSVLAYKRALNWRDNPHHVEAYWMNTFGRVPQAKAIIDGIRDRKEIVALKSNWRFFQFGWKSLLEDNQTAIVARMLSKYAKYGKEGVDLFLSRIHDVGVQTMETEVYLLEKKEIFQLYWKFRNCSKLDWLQPLRSWTEDIPIEEYLLLKKEDLQAEICRKGVENSYGKVVPELLPLATEAYQAGVSDFNTLTQYWFNKSPVKSIPWVNVSEGTYTLKTLDVNDPRGPFLGRYTGCCQSYEGFASECAIHGMASKDGCFWVVFNSKRLVAQAWVWVSNRILVIDNIEGASGDPTVYDLFKRAVKSVRADGIGAVYCGLGYNKYSEKLQEEYQVTRLPVSAPVNYTDTAEGVVKLASEGHQDINFDLIVRIEELAYPEFMRSYKAEEFSLEGICEYLECEPSEILAMTEGDSAYLLGSIQGDEAEIADLAKIPGSPSSCVARLITRCMRVLKQNNVKTVTMDCRSTSSPIVKSLVNRMGLTMTEETWDWEGEEMTEITVSMASEGHDEDFGVDLGDVEVLLQDLWSVKAKTLLIGGAVIDRIQGRQIKDWDIEVYGLSMKQLQDYLEEWGYKADMVGAAFGIIKVKVGTTDIDLNVPRLENRCGVGHKGFQVELLPNLTPEEAGKRRDLTINSMYVNLHTGEVVDHFGGMKDLNEGILRATCAETFIEDPLRVLRIMQLLPRKGKKVASETIELCRSMQSEYPTLPKERIFEEFKKLLLKANKPSMGLEFLKDCGWIKWFLALEALIGCQQNPEHHPEGDAWVHTLMVLDNAAILKDQVPEPWKLAYMFGAMLHDVGKPQTTDRETLTAYGHDQVGIPIARQFMESMTNEVDLINKVELIVGNHMMPGQFHQSGAGVAAWRRLHNRIRLDVIGLMSKADSCGRKGYSLNDPHIPSQMAFGYFESFGEGKIEPILMGRHLVSRGYKQGKEMGLILKRAYEHQIETGETDVNKLFNAGISLNSEGHQISKIIEQLNKHGLFIGDEHPNTPTPPEQANVKYWALCMYTHLRNTRYYWFPICEGQKESCLEDQVKALTDKDIPLYKILVLLEKDIYVDLTTSNLEQKDFFGHWRHKDLGHNPMVRNKNSYYIGMKKDKEKGRLPKDFPLIRTFHIKWAASILNSFSPLSFKELLQVSCRTQKPFKDCYVAMWDLDYPTDLLKVPAGYARWLIDTVALRDSLYASNKMPFGKHAPKNIEKLRFLPIPSIDIPSEALNSRHDYYVWLLTNSTRYYDLSSDYSLLTPREIRATVIGLKVISSKTAYKQFCNEVLHVKAIPSMKKMDMLIRFIKDGAQLLNDDIPGTRRYNGSPVRILETAIWNHQRAIENDLSTNIPMPNEVMPCNKTLPPSWEDLRIKTKLDMVKIGSEMRHCLGSYKDSRDLFFRKGTVCAQVSVQTGKVVQCFDMSNRITSASKDFAQQLKKVKKYIVDPNTPQIKDKIDEDEDFLDEDFYSEGHMDSTLDQEIFEAWTEWSRSRNYHGSEGLSPEEILALKQELNKLGENDPITIDMARSLADDYGFRVRINSYLTLCDGAYNPAMRTIDLATDPTKRILFHEVGHHLDRLANHYWRQDFTTDSETPESVGILELIAEMWAVAMCQRYTDESKIYQTALWRNYNVIRHYKVRGKLMVLPPFVNVKPQWDRVKDLLVSAKKQHITVFMAAKILNEMDYNNILKQTSTSTDTEYNAAPSPHPSSRSVTSPRFSFNRSSLAGARSSLSYTYRAETLPIRSVSNPTKKKSSKTQKEKPALARWRSLAEKVKALLGYSSLT